jgi:hypothetical protein
MILHRRTQTLILHISLLIDTAFACGARSVSVQSTMARGPAPLFDRIVEVHNLVVYPDQAIEIPATKEV